jgi:hypothetical protein
MARPAPASPDPPLGHHRIEVKASDQSECSRRLVLSIAALATALLSAVYVYIGAQFSQNVKADENVAAAPSLPVVVMVLVVGIGMGGVAVWAWAMRSRPRPNRQPLAQPTAPSRLEAAASSGVPQVFVSYSHQDSQTVEQLVEQLGYAVWIDRRSSGAQRYAAPIVRAIRMSRLVAVMASQNAFASDHVIREVYIAGDYKKPFIELDLTAFPDDVLYFVSGFPRVPVATMEQKQLELEIARLVAA